MCISSYFNVCYIRASILVDIIIRIYSRRHLLYLLKRSHSYVVILKDLTISTGMMITCPCMIDAQF